MAEQVGLGRRLGRTAPGYLLWKISRGTALQPAVDAAARTVTALGWAVARRLPAHRRHDRAQRTTLAAFEAETRRRVTR